MTKEEHNKLLTELRNCTSDADRMTLISKLERDYTGVLSERDTATETAQQAQAEAVKFAKLNNELWLQNSAQDNVTKVTPTTKETEPNNEIQDNPPKKMTYEDLESKF